MISAKKIIGESDGLSKDDGEELTDLEEIFFRSHSGAYVDKEALLEKKTKNKGLLARLLKIEREAIRRARAKGIVTNSKGVGGESP